MYRTEVRQYCNFHSQDSLIPRALSSFDISFGACEMFMNDERTRSFFSLSVTEGKEQVCALIARIDDVFKQFRLPTYYAVRCPVPTACRCWSHLRHRILGRT